MSGEKADVKRENHPPLPPSPCAEASEDRSKGDTPEIDMIPEDHKMRCLNCLHNDKEE